MRISFTIFDEVPKYDGDLGHPNVFVPIDRKAAEAKADALMKHFGTQTGRSWFTRETFLGLMRVRAIEVQCAEEFAEAFHARKILFGGLDGG